MEIEVRSAQVRAPPRARHRPRPPALATRTEFSDDECAAFELHELYLHHCVRANGQYYAPALLDRTKLRPWDGRDLAQIQMGSVCDARALFESRLRAIAKAERHRCLPREFRACGPVVLALLHEQLHRRLQRLAQLEVDVDNADAQHSRHRRRT